MPYFQAQMDEQARLLSERGMVLIGQEDCDEDESASSAVDENEQDKRTRAIVSSETANILGTLGQGPLDVRIKRLADERDDLQDSVRRLKLDLEEERNRNSKLEKSPFNPEEADWETKKLIDDYKFKMQKAEQDINTLQTNVSSKFTVAAWTFHVVLCYCYCLLVIIRLRGWNHK